MKSQRALQAYVAGLIEDILRYNWQKMQKPTNHISKTPFFLMDLTEDRRNRIRLYRA